jgi:hypothetical protein
MFVLLCMLYLSQKHSGDKLDRVTSQAIRSFVAMAWPTPNGLPVFLQPCIRHECSDIHALFAIGRAQEVIPESSTDII